MILALTPCVSYLTTEFNIGFQNCPVFNNCYTYPSKYKDKILYNNNIQIDAIVFHGPEINKNDIDRLKSQRNELKKSNKEHDPYFVLFNLVKSLKLINSEVLQITSTKNFLRNLHYTHITCQMISTT